MKFLEKFNLFKKKDNYHRYKQESYPGQSIEEYSKELVIHSKELHKNKLVNYAALVATKQPITIGEFNGIELIVKNNDTKESIIEQYYKKLKNK